MAIITDIIGNGHVEVTEDETSVMLDAQPIKGYDFKHFVIEGKEIPRNPYLLDKSSGNLNVQAVFYESINSYLQGCASFDISIFIPKVLRGRKVQFKEDLDHMDERTIFLCEADLYMEMRKLPSTRQHERDSDGGWSHDGGSITISNSYRKILMADALTIYQKYGDERANEVITSNENAKEPIKVTINLL